MPFASRVRKEKKKLGIQDEGLEYKRELNVCMKEKTKREAMEGVLCATEKYIKSRADPGIQSRIGIF